MTVGMATLAADEIWMLILVINNCVAELLAQSRSSATQRSSAALSASGHCSHTASEKCNTWPFIVKGGAANFGTVKDCKALVNGKIVIVREVASLESISDWTNEWKSCCFCLVWFLVSFCRNPMLLLCYSFPFTYCEGTKFWKQSVGCSQAMCSLVSASFHNFTCLIFHHTYTIFSPFIHSSSQVLVALTDVGGHRQVVTSPANATWSSFYFILLIFALCTPPVSC